MILARWRLIMIIVKERVTRGHGDTATRRRGKNTTRGRGDAATRRGKKGNSYTGCFYRRVAASPRRVLLFRFGGANGFDPCIPTAFKSPHLLVAFVEEHLRHTGAGVFARSSAVDDDLPVAWNL